MDLLMTHLWAAGYVLSPETPEPVEKPAKGVCPTCRKRIGRGLHFHARSCKG